MSVRVQKKQARELGEKIKKKVKKFEKQFEKAREYRRNQFRMARTKFEKVLNKKN